MTSRLVAVSLWLALAGCGGSEPPASPSGASTPGTGSWITLFDGTNLDAFESVGDANWSIENGWVGADSGNGFLVTREDFGDFDLELEFWVDVPANSGVFLRCADSADISAASCYEVNIFDTRPDQTYRSGAVVDVAAPAETVNTGGRWNAYEIGADGPRLTVRLNGVETVDVEDSQHTRGPVALQYGAGRVLFRNVRIRPH